MVASYKVSVIIPIYNVAEYLEECLDSMVNQTIDSLEVIMVDDGSTDISGVIAKRYAEKYDNFFYYLKENGGLGNARNYGLQFVNGEYIVFLDSDDVVPNDAYEAMYNKAVETGNDMVVGDVKRFNSTRVYNSALHRKAFLNAKDFTTILETPELIYDTTSWNKLIKFSFWKKHDFKFPEKILYEDIPVTMPLHFYANSVSIINQVVYLWRARDGANKSITQNRKELRNFTDRIKIMKMVDAFYQEHVNDERALYMKDYKWMEVDLKLYIQELIDADEEYMDKLFGIIQDYFPSFREDSFKDLPAIDRMKYYLIMHNQKQKLIELLKYEKECYRTLKVKKVTEKHGIKYIGNFPFDYFPKEYYDMTREFNLCRETRAVHSAKWDGKVLTIEGFNFINRLTCPKQESQKLSASLVNINTNEKIPLPLKVKKAKGVRGKYGFKASRKNKKFAFFNYNWSGYQIEIDFNRLEILKIANGQLKVELLYQRDELERVFYVGGPVAGDDPRPSFINNQGINILPFYNLGYDLCFECTHLDAIAEECTLQDNFLLLKGMARKQVAIKAVGQNNVIIPEITYSKTDKNYAYDTNQNLYHFHAKFDLNALESSNTYSLKYDDKNNMFIDCLHTSYYVQIPGRLMRISYREGTIIDFPTYKSVLTNYTVNNLKVNLKVTVFGINRMEETVSLVFKSQNNKLTSPKVNVENIEFKNNKAICSFTIDFKDEAFIKNLMADKWTMYLIYYEGNNEIEEPVYGDFISNEETIQDKAYSYKIKAEKNVDSSYAYLLVNRVWKWYESNKLRRKAIVLFIYPLFRLLPIRKNTIVFEGWWGQKYHCNPRAFYEYMNEHHPEYKCIWSLNDERLPIDGNAKVVRRNSLAYHKVMARSQYFVNNVNFDESYRKRKGQIEIQTMHGTPLKTLGLDVPGELPTEEARRKFIEKCDRWNYLVVQSDKASKITASCYAFKKQFLRTGYPRNDVLFAKNNESDINAIKSKLGIPANKKVILYAPTWRVRNRFDMQIDVDKLKESISDEYVLLLRIHPFAVRGLDESLIDNQFIFNVSTYPYVEELYLISDMVITDYSSVMFDYAILNRPMLFFTYDLEDYRDTLRGFNFDFVAEAPGPLLKTSDEVIDAVVNIIEVSEKYDEALQKFRRKFCEYEHGNASEQIYSIVMKGNE